MFQRIKQFLIDYQRPYKEIGKLIQLNKSEVNKSNCRMFNELCAICSGLMVFMTIIKAVGTGSGRLCIIYLLAVLMIGVIYCVFQHPVLQNYKLFGIYLLAVLAYTMTIYLSIVRSPDQRATAIIGLICFVPLCMIDKPSRIAIFTMFFFTLHAGLAFMVKAPHTALVDAENSLCFALLGLFFGRNSVLAKVKVMDAQRQLVKDKTTDALTQISNRRKLFEDIGLIRDGKSACPDGVMLLDIDHFKEYNDQFGHCCGDECLSLFGALLLDISENYSVTFYRYGGEEFVGFVYGCTGQELAALAQQICDETRKIETTYTAITVSIGSVFCDDAAVVNYETWIKRADAAAYRAKENGRNQVVSY